jgi:hypothetical protein
MKNQLLILGFILLAGFSCQSKEPKLPDTPLSEQNLKFEICDSLVVDYLGNLILMDISPDQKHFLLIDQNTDSIFVTDPMGVILNRYKRFGEGPEDYNDTRSGLAKFISNTEFILPATRGMYLYSLAGDLNQKYLVDFYPDFTIVFRNSDNIALHGNKIYTDLSGRYTDEGFEGVEYQQKARKIEVLDLVPPKGYWRDLPLRVQKKFMGGSFYLGGGKTGIARRIGWDEPCLTLTCSPAQKQTERCHPDETRPFTVREYARIQTFPDDWNFEGSVAQQYKQIGNAVPINLGREVGYSIIKFLNSYYSLSKPK